MFTLSENIGVLSENAELRIGIKKEEECIVKKSLVLLALLVAALLVANAGAANADDMRVRIGVSSGPHTEIAELVREIAAGKGLEIEIITFGDFILPNTALADGEIDVNSFQHLPYLQSMMENRGYRLTPIGNTVLMPMAVYSRRIDSIDELRDGATVGIPNDPSNGGRALLLLATQGLIELDPAAGVLPSVIDVTRNDRRLRFVELDAALLPRALDDTDIAVINTNFAVEAGLVPARDSLILESSESPYVNVIVVREGEEDRPEFRILVESYQNDKVKNFVEERFGGAIVVGW